MIFSLRVLSIFSVFLLGAPAWAAKVVTVKQGRALVDLESDRYPIGTKLFAVDEQGKRKGVLVIQKVKGGKAIAQVTKGVAKANYILLTGSKNKDMSSAPRGARAWGVLGGMNNNAVSVAQKNASAIEMAGSSFSVRGFYQEQLDGRWGVRGSFGYDSMVASGNSTSTSCLKCEVNITYLGLDALVRYDITRGSYKLWGGLGLGFLYPMSKSSNALDTSKITINQTIIGSLGMDIGLSGGSFIPVELSYAMFPNTNTSSAKQMTIKIGYGFSF